jgi:hypothetical protein
VGFCATIIERRPDAASAGSVFFWPYEPLMENAALFRMTIERGFNQGDVSVADEVCAAKLIEHEYLAPTDLPGPDILKTQIRAGSRGSSEFSSDDRGHGRGRRQDLGAEHMYRNRFALG